MSKEEKSQLFKDVIAYNCLVRTAEKVRFAENVVAERAM